jgi:hypothetical protein
MESTKFHPDFLKRVFAINDGALLAAVGPICAARNTDDPDGYERDLREFLSLYAEHLRGMSDKDFYAALFRAGEIMQARASAEGDAK